MARLPRTAGEKTAIFTDGGSNGTAGGSQFTNLTGTITLASTGGVDAYSQNAMNIQGQITGPGTLQKGIIDTAATAVPNGGGTVTLSNTGNNYQGGTVVLFGTLAQGASGVIPYGPNVGDLTVSGGTFGNGTRRQRDLRPRRLDAPINGLWGNGTVTDGAASGNNILTVGNNNATSTFAGVIENPSGAVDFANQNGHRVAEPRRLQHLHRRHHDQPGLFATGQRLRLGHGRVGRQRRHARPGRFRRHRVQPQRCG